MKTHKMDKEIVDVLTPCIKSEYDAFYFYRAAANWCRGEGFEKAASFFEGEANDELTHAKKLEDYITDWNVLPQLPPIPKPQISFSGLMEIITLAYEMEYELYELYEEVSDKVLKKGEHCTYDVLGFFRGVQNASVIEYSDKINMLEGVSGTKFELLLLEDKLFA